MELDPNRSTEFALTLEFCSPFKETEIWITEIVDRAERNHFAHTDQTVDRALHSGPKPAEPESPLVPAQDHQPSEAPPARNRRRSRKARKGQQAKDPTPKDEKQHQQAKIEFPKAD
jgi:hypothetical protein